MKCPVCEETTISFGQWCRTPNAFFWQCRLCGSSLKANGVTWRWLIVGLLFMMIILSGVIAFERNGALDVGQSKPLLFVCFVIALVPTALMAYNWGGYVERR